MKQHTVGVIMNGVTGRMGTNQHLLRSIAAIIKQGGVHIGPGETIMPDPVLVGRDENKLWLPGILKLKRLIQQEFFGKILSVRGEFGYWVFEGDSIPAQGPSWNYRKEDDGGIIVDMLCHWRYLLDNVFGKVKAVSCLGAIHIPERIDEQGKPYKCTADDSAYATFEL